MMKSNRKDKFTPCQSSSQWDFQSHKRHRHHSNLLGIVCHEPLEIGDCYTFLHNNCAQFLPKYTLGFNVLWLHVANNSRHYFPIDQVIDMASHSHPALNTFNMIKHHPRILQVNLKLHFLDLMHSTTILFYQHFEKINLLPKLLPKKTTILNVILRIKGLEHEDGIK